MTGRYIYGDALSAVTSLENDEPQHIFFIGLAYLGGIDVEVCRDLSISYSKLAAQCPDVRPFTENLAIVREYIQ